MRYSTQIKPISYLKANAAEVLDELNQLRKPLIITQNGEAKAVLQDVATYEETQEAMALLRVLALGNQQIAQGVECSTTTIGKQPDGRILGQYGDATSRSVRHQASGFPAAVRAPTWA